MRRAFATALLSTLAVTLAAQAPAPPPIYGFNDPAKQRALEQKFDAAMNPADLRAWMERMTSHPHHIGTAKGKDNAEFMASLFRSWGFDTAIERFDVLFPTPKTRVLEMVAPEHFTAKLAEPPLPEDATSNQTAEALPTYNAYSIDGDVTGELVYVNYGVPKDYETLERNGVDVKGKIVIARYGASWRGIKPKVAAEHGAIGCLIYSDPRDDGYFEGEPYPRGAYRSDQSAQRGSVADMPYHPGDPRTPGVGATENATRLPMNEVKTLTKIPVLPISYGDALPLLRALGGPVAPNDWRGALPITYHLGSGPARVHLQLAFDWNTVPAYDVIARLKGTDLADQWVIRGNHHDAWVHGALDPVSGMVGVLEEAKGVGALAKTGWRPRRTMIYCAWDGEEPGLLGSTEWVETHADELRQHAVAYINSDSNGRGFFFAGGSHSLERLVNEAARDVVDPERKVSMLERRRAADLAFANSAGERKELRGQDSLRLDALGSGSDFTPFLQFAGVATLDIGYGGESEYGVYHSIYDSFSHFMRFGDPTFDYGVAEAKTGGRMMLRLANADFLPFETTTFATTVGRYLDEVKKLADSMRDETEELNRELQDRAQELASDPTKPFVAPKAQAAVPHLEFAPLDNAVAHLQRAARDFDKRGATPGRDATLMQLERALTRSEGLPNRPWFKHYVYAPGFYTGYDVKTLPAVREAIEQRKWGDVNAQIRATAEVLENYARMLEKT
ncbi:MAG: M28 family metallopeptidase [Acidobacteria bacterium]|nr:M28 family metallopeptidase [Acidobacteriota bacterium]MBV9475713.1 M28 family metallopeptidase [Acidobacteriota bacterium]